MNGLNIAFYLTAFIALLSTLKAITQLNAVRALLYLIVSLLSVAILFFLLGAPFAAALEVIAYAGAIMVLFIFVIMMLNLGPATLALERQWLSRKMWLGPFLLAAVLFGELIYFLFWRFPRPTEGGGLAVSPEKVGETLLGTYAVGVELSSLLLLAGLLGAHRLARSAQPKAVSR